MQTWVFRLLVAAALWAFGAQVATRVRLTWRAGNNIRLDCPGERAWRVVREVVFQSRVISERPLVGIAHALVFWGFVSFSLYTLIGILKGLGAVDLTDRAWYGAYRLALVPFAVAVLAGILGLVVRRVVVRPPGLGDHVSGESVLIGLFIATLMVTFLVEPAIEDPLGARLNWWVHELVLFAFLVLIPNSKHLHLVVSPLTIFLRSPALATVPNLDFEKEEVGIETVGQIERKQVLDAFTCVECGRCQDNCPAHATGKALNPKTLILRNEEAVLAGRFDQKLSDLYDPNVLWQCTTCGACENQCPVGIEHLPLVVGARRGLVSNGEAPDQLGAVFNNLERRGNIWGLGYDQRDKFVAASGFELFDEARHEYLLWLGCAGAFEADFQKSLRALGAILARYGVTFGVLPREKCTGDLAKRTGNEYIFQELARSNIEAFEAAKVTRILTACPHCLKTMGDDYRAFGFTAEVEHASVLLARLTGGLALAGHDEVAFHDPCYLGRYAGRVEEPRELLMRAGASLREPERRGSNPFCCGAGGGLLFEEREEGKRISQERLEQLEATGAGTIVTACPFCTIMLKGAQASGGENARVTDLMSYVNDRLQAQ